MSELKPCPFCGEEPELFDFTDGRFIVQCSNSDCDVYPYTSIHRDKADAIAAWNHRATVYTKPTTLSQLQADNAKLRELVRDYEHCSVHADCGRCEYDGKLSTHCPLSPCFPDADELRELGVEVDE